MADLNRLLAATDLSAPARHAVERAAFVARDIGAALDLVHVASLAPLDKLRRLVAAMPEGLEQRMLDAVAQELRELAAALQRHHGVHAGVHLGAGSLLPELTRQADERAADLLVLGARGANFMRHLLLGSTAERMVSRTSRPLLVVKQAAHERYRSLLVAVDFSPSSLPALRHARAIAPGADIIVLHVFDVPFEGKLRIAGVDDETIERYQVAAEHEASQKLRRLCGQAGWKPRDARQMVLRGDPMQRIVEQEQEQDCDLIVMGKQGESMLEQLFLGSVTRHVLAQSQGDVLVSV